MTIREATESDFPKLQDLNQQIFLTEIEACSPRSWNSDHPYNEYGINYLQSAIKKQNFEAFVYEEAGEVIAYIILNLVKEDDCRHRPELTLAQINTFCVDKSYRGKGIGKQMVEFAKKWATDKGANHMKVIATAGNTGACDFYEDNGFEAFEITYEAELD